MRKSIVINEQKQQTRIVGKPGIGQIFRNAMKMMEKNECETSNGAKQKKKSCNK